MKCFYVEVSALFDLSYAAIGKCIKNLFFLFNPYLPQKSPVEIKYIFLGEFWLGGSNKLHLQKM